MAKDSERQAAQVMYIDQCLTAKEISERLGVSQKTIGKWVDAGTWRELRSAKQTGPHAINAKYNELLEMLVDKRLALEKKIKRSEEEENEYGRIIDEMSKVSAMMERSQKDGKVSLRIHIHCIEEFSAFLQMKSPALFSQLIGVQQEYLPLLAERLNNA